MKYPYDNKNEKARYLESWLGSDFDEIYTKAIKSIYKEAKRAFLEEIDFNPESYADSDEYEDLVKQRNSLEHGKTISEIQFGFFYKNKSYSFKNVYTYPGRKDLSTILEKNESLKKAILRVVNKLHEKLEKVVKRSDFYIYNIMLFDFTQAIPIHTDSLDVNLKYRDSYDEVHSLLSEEEWLENENPRRPFVQGIVPLEFSKSEKHGTIIFNQTFPFSVYYQPGIEIVGLKNKKNILFNQKNDITRYGQAIRDFTFKDFSKNDYRKMMKDFSLSKQDRAAENYYNYDNFYGLSIDKVAIWKKPGDLILWDRKAFHIPKPISDSYNRPRRCMAFLTNNV